MMEVRNAAEFISIQAAINDLPIEGGKVIIPPGTYVEAIDVPRNVVIEGVNHNKGMGK